ncbi:hypothetical protein K504DRAFT_506464 [Pleomassaria siparia CBS 279.74]|uniref:Zn(2)-C6 fungal-type domain-containing protein n=1 Tax=Pleomassaria siparia CBS 279.74 TaxID=1314801 RepID=A0A6G1JWK8_9PLEO|nr:hypothetical protein K504DRAFT_506464 [Pleomassaria siparia CBS 279.74]
MPPKLPACDPCRSKKLACDHLQPVCTRCQDGNQSDSCTYRTRPFKKRKILNSSIDASESEPQQGEVSHFITPVPVPSSSPVPAPSSSPAPAPLAKLLKKSQHYPNPGYLGPSSHTTFFDHLSAGNSPGTNIDGRQQDTWKTVVNDGKIAHGAALIDQIRSSAHISLWGSLVEAWTALGINLPLAESFTMQCTQTVQTLFQCSSPGEEGSVDLSRDLFLRSCSSLAMSVDSLLEHFCATFCGTNARWETVGLFFTAVSRATIDIPCFDALYKLDRERRSLQRLAMHYADSCLDISLSLDCLNDLQLILQYENFILHSLVDGYHSWRKLGDVASSLFALGYHEQLGSKFVVPEYLRVLREEAFNRAYSADKNVSIFLGRPPRINMKYCPIARRHFQWNPEKGFSYTADTWWASLCAALKEDILDLRKEDQSIRAEKASRIRADAEAQWVALPAHFHLNEPLSFYDRRPVEMDFLVGTRLNYLHVKFMLQLSLVHRVSEPESELLAISAGMLSIVVEAIVLKHRLANSGTSLVAYYGLAAAGVICLALLNSAFGGSNTEVSASKSIRDLSVLVAQVETGALVQPEDPNYALLSGAAQTIKNLLDRLITNKFSKQPPIQAPPPEPFAHASASYVEEDWNSWDNQGLQEFDPDFWLNLAEHPFLIAPHES